MCLFAWCNYAHANEPLRVAVFVTDLSDQNLNTLASADDVFDQIAQVDADILWLGEVPADINNKALAAVLPRLQAQGYTTFFSTDVNSGVPTGLDIDQDGDEDDGRDAFGFGAYPGQDGMLVATKNLPIDYANIRTFQTFLWSDMPNNRLPAGYLTPQAQAIVRLSTTGHWDVPIATPMGTVHLLVSHNSPPVFDGPEDYNGRRNADQLRFWADYLDDADYIYDDAGQTGGLPETALFVLGGGFNLDPTDGDGIKSAIHGLLDHPRIQDTQPASDYSPAQTDINATHLGNPALDTVDWWDKGKTPPGNLRVDYGLPARALKIIDSGVHWTPDSQSKHKIVWIDIAP